MVEKEKDIETLKNESLEVNEPDLLDIIDIDENAPKKVREANDVYEQLKPQEKEAVTTLVAYQFKGPLPHPSILKGYEDIEKGLADRIVKMAERDQEAHIKNNDKILQFQGRDALLGSIFAFLTVIGVLIAGVILLLNDKDLAGFVTLIAGAGSIVALFLRSKDHKEDKKSDDKK